ncbi:hypothetical protein ES676_09045 [Bizionia saleffrena]|uniref:BamA/TamA family outer membrane protein n=1 Tax=Bizionia saleffrena TaxID=291189 RepID=A0A8H2LEI9_9FLAO|nr:hypothetical protein ES676_09045 [Bizionia saleffrena]
MTVLVKKKPLVFLIIFIILSSTSVAQNLYLEVTGETDSITEILKNYSTLKKFPEASAVLDALGSLKESLYNDGYINHTLINNSKKNDSTFAYQVRLHSKYEYITITFNKNTINPKEVKHISKLVTENEFTIPFQDIEATLDFLTIKVSKNGFPFAQLNLENISAKNKNTLQAELKISNTTEKRKLDAIVVKGYEKFPKSYLRRFLKITPQKSFNIETIKKKLNGLNNLRFAKQIKDPEVLFSKDSTTLYLYLEKTQSNAFDGYLGFSTNEETNTLEFNGFINLDLNNNFNFGESFALHYKSTENEQKTFDVALNLPYLFNTPIGTEFELNILKKDSSFTTVKQSAKVFYQIDTKSRFFLGIDTYTSNSLLKNPVFTTTDDYTTNFYTSKYTFENRNASDLLFPINTYFALEAGLGKRTRDNTGEKQTKLAVTTFHNIKFNAQNSFFVKVSGALLNTKNHLENELFRFGGINSIRGFAEESLLATKFAVINTEYRYRLSKTIYAHSIIDYATLNNTLTQQKNNLYGFGIGFGIITRAGVLKLNYANGKTESQEFEFSNSNIHLSLSSFF